MTAVEVLRAAREKVAAGWCKGADRNRDGRYCLMGAINAATDDWDALAPARQGIYRLVGDTPRTWNDAIGRTQAEVLAVLDQAIAAEEARS